MSEDKLKLAAEITNKAKEHCIPIIIFETQEDMKICLEDMRIGAVVREGLKTIGVPIKKEYWM